MLRQILLALIILAAAIAAATFVVKSKKPPEHVEKKESVVLVDALEVNQQNLALNIKVQGRVEAKQKTNLVGEVSGKVNYVSPKFETGAFVKKGDVLLKIDNTDYRLQLETARANKISAESNLAQEETRARVAQQEWEWRERKALDQRAKDIALRKPQLKAAAANVKAASLQINSAQQQLAKTVIKAPYDAIISSKQVELGQFISPGVPIGALFSIDAANVRLAVPEKKLKYLSLPNVYGQGGNKHVHIYTNENPEQQWPATIVRSEGMIDPQTQFLYVLAEIKDPYGLRSNSQQTLRIGAFVNANMQGKEIAGLVGIPDSVIHRGNRVWLVSKDSLLVEKTLQIEYKEDAVTYVKGLKSGDRILTTVIPNTLPGQKVKINQLQTQNAVENLSAQEH